MLVKPSLWWVGLLPLRAGYSLRTVRQNSDSHNGPTLREGHRPNRPEASKPIIHLPHGEIVLSRHRVCNLPRGSLWTCRPLQQFFHGDIPHFATHVLASSSVQLLVSYRSVSKFACIGFSKSFENCTPVRALWREPPGDFAQHLTRHQMLRP